MATTTSLRPQHRSTLNRRLEPRGMAIAKLGDEQRKFIEAQALSIFTDMVNSGASLQQTLAAVFLSGMSAAREVTA